MVGIGVYELEPVTALTSLGLALVDVEVGEERLSLLAMVADETLVVHGGDDIRVLAGALAALVGLNVPRIFDARSSGHPLELLDTDRVLQGVGERQFLLQTDLGGGDAASQGSRRHSGPQGRAANGSQTKGRHDSYKKSVSHLRF